jgi:hypothetical protein
MTELKPAELDIVSAGGGCGCDDSLINVSNNDIAVAVVVGGGTAVAVS